MFKRRWDRFMCPNGIRRTFNPWKWEHGTSVLVFGEFLALCSAVAAIPNWPYNRWFLYSAPIIAAGALFWYALDKSSLGEMPLTGVSANRIANVVRLVNLETNYGPIFDWDTIAADGTRVEVNFTKANLDIKKILARTLLTHAAQPNLAEEHSLALVNQMSESDIDDLLGAFMPPGMTFG